MRDQRTSRAARRMFDVEHFVVKDVLHDELRNGGMVHAAVEKDLVGSRIVTAKLAPPGATAPAKMRASKIAFEKLSIQRIEHLHEIEEASLRTGCRGADARAAHTLNALPSALRAGVVKIWLSQGLGRAAAVNARKQQGGGAFQYGKAALPHQVRKANIDGLFAAANGENKVSVGIKLDVKARRPTLATETRINALKKCCASG